ncbi:heme-binding protein [Massilia oculi]|uniref:heme-binding protein n=1 Tax=Massilia oculi TaxID=945844 RepID=UPI0028ADCDA5|nr:heme-binding protein [Massilia oculi]
MLANLPLRAAAPDAEKTARLGPLAELEGSWFGRGFDLIALPDKQNNGIFRLMLNSTMERIDFTAIGSPVPNRGFAQDDILIYGLTYTQQVNDAEKMGTLHIENGMWLNVPETTAPPAPASIVRQASVPHGNALLVQGTGRTVQGKPDISPISTKPTGPGMANVGLGYLDPYSHSNLPTGMKQGYVTDMSLPLRDAMEGQNIVSNVLLNVASSATDSGVVSIPFAGPNAEPVGIKATFWIETVQRPDGSQFLQLQYSQTVMLRFFDIDWPHVSVGTLIKT